MKKEKGIILAVCGSIAAYKAPFIVRRLKERGWNVRVIMTESAVKFITPLTMETVSENPVYVKMFDCGYVREIEHIALSDYGRILLVAPATANMIGKTAAGIADDLVSTTVMAYNGKVVFAPAMNYRMWENPIVAGNVRKLKKSGVLFIGPERGKLAEGTTGQGRLADIKNIIEFIEKISSG